MHTQKEHALSNKNATKTQCNVSLLHSANLTTIGGNTQNAYMYVLYPYVVQLQSATQSAVT